MYIITIRLVPFRFRYCTNV